MAKFVLTDASATIGGTDLSDHIESITVNVDVDVPDATTMSSSGWREFLGGLKGWNVDIGWTQDFAASNVDATIWAALGTSAAFVGKPVSGSVTATNPSLSGNVIVGGSYAPISGSVGDVTKTSTSWQGTGALTRATS